MPNVYIVNKSAHDFSDAKRFGRLVFMSEGRLNRYSTNNMVRRFSQALKNSHEDDYLLPCSLNIANIIAGAVFAKIHGRINLLIFQPSSREYLERVHILS